jgi:hypothetical protein
LKPRRFQQALPDNSETQFTSGFARGLRHFPAVTPTAGPPNTVSLIKNPKVWMVRNKMTAEALNAAAGAEFSRKSVTAAVLSAISGHLLQTA